MSQLNIGLAVIGFVVVAIGLVSNQIKRSPVQEPLGLPVAALAVAILLLRRPVVVALLWPGLRPRLAGADLKFIGWFGPIGVAAIYYAFFARSHGMGPLVWHVASAVIFASILAHGVTAAPFTRLYARSQPAEPEPAKPEMAMEPT